jgi:DNA-directed RNA polymerase omega subunit
MNDFDRATKNIGNRFDLVLVASERMRELHQQRRRQEEQAEKCLTTKRNQPVPAHQAIRDIEQGTVGREYLARVRDRKRRPSRYDDIT